MLGHRKADKHINRWPNRNDNKICKTSKTIKCELCHACTVNSN